MRKIKLVFFIIVAITMMTSGNVLAKPGWGEGDCTGCHGSPTVQEFSIPDTYDALTFPIYSVVAHDTDPNKPNKAGVTGYLITESDTAPSAGDPGWTGTPPNNYTLDVPGNKTLYAWAKDTIGNVSASLSAVIEIVIPEPNQAPVADAGADQLVSEGDFVTLSGSNSGDPDGSIDDYYWEQIGGPTVALSDVNSIRPSFAAPAVDQTGVTLTFRLTVTDDAADDASDTCIVDVSWVNEAPVADAGPDQNLDEESYVTLNGANSSDQDNNIADYYWEQIGGPTVTLSDVNSISPSFAAPAVDQTGVALTFRLTVTDDAADDASDTCIVNVTWVNEAPTADAGAEQTVDEGMVVTLDGSNSSDPDDGDGIASYVWKEVGTTLVTLSDDKVATPSFTTPFVDQGSISLTFELTVTDRGGLKSTDTSVVNVSWVNEAPTADAGTDQNVDEGDLVTLDASNSTDPDDGIKSYLWTQVGTISGNSVTLSDPAADKPTFEAPAVEAEGASVTFQVTVTDNDGLQSTDTCIVNVNAVENTPVNEAPTADAGADQTVDEEDIVTLDASKSSDPDDGIKSYMWAQIGMVAGVSVTLSDPTAVQPTFEAPMVGAAGASMTFQVTVTDISGLQSSDTCIVNVNPVDNTPVNQAPRADAGPDQTAKAGNVVTLDGSNSSDPDGVIASYMWKQTDGMSVTLSNPTAVKPTFNCPAGGRQGTSLTFQVTVMDIDGMQSSDSCVVNINAIDIPAEEEPLPIPGDDDDETRTGEPREKLQLIREDLMAMVKDGEFSRKARKMFSHSAKRLFKAAEFLEKGKVKKVSKEIEKAIQAIKKAAKIERRNFALKIKSKELIQDLKEQKAEIKTEGNKRYKDDDDDDHDDEDNRHHDDHDDDHDHDNHHRDDHDDEDDD